MGIARGGRRGPIGASAGAVKGTRDRPDLGRATGRLPVNIHGEVDYPVIHTDDKPGSRWDARFCIPAVTPTFVT